MAFYEKGNQARVGETGSAGSGLAIKGQPPNSPVIKGCSQQHEFIGSQDKQWATLSPFRKGKKNLST